jgi:large subunit ribosomal protein L3
MPTRKSPRKGSLQFWPRKRAKKLLPRVNWNIINSEKNLKGFLVYKVGMTTAIIKDNTPNSMTKGKDIALPVTIIECPNMKILSVRFYKNNKVSNEILGKNLDKELKKIIKIPKKIKEIDSIKKEDYDDIRIIVYSQTKNTGIKKKPDLIEIGLQGNLEEKINFIKDNLNKEFSVTDFFDKGQLVDVRGLTKGKGFQGPVKRFGIKLRSHKTEKGVRKVGSIGPWHPARITFRVPMAGQLGMFTRVDYNKKIIDIGKAENKKELKNLKNYGNIKKDYILLSGSIPGSSKRQLLITAPLRKSKRTKKKNYELLEIK